MKRVPVTCPNEDLTDEEFRQLKENLGRRVFRKPASVQAGPIGIETEQDQEGGMEAEYIPEEWTKEERLAKIKEYGEYYRGGSSRYSAWMYRQIVEDLWWNEWLVCSLYQVRYALSGH